MRASTDAPARRAKTAATSGIVVSITPAAITRPAVLWESGSDEDDHHCARQEQQLAIAAETAREAVDDEEDRHARGTTSGDLSSVEPPSANPN